MVRDVFVKDIEELFQTSIVQQTSFWSEVKNRLGTRTLAVNFSSAKQRLYTQVSTDEQFEADLLVVLQPVNNEDYIAYVPYGPEIEPDEEMQGAFLEELSEVLRSHLPLNCIMIRYDLCWESYWAKDSSYFDEDGHWLGEPEKSTTEMRFNFSTRDWKFRKAQFNILPSNTIFVDLKPDLSAILARMKPKTRYNIGLSRKKGVAVHSYGMEKLEVWYQLYKETASRNRIVLNDLRYFEAILTARAENTSSPAQVRLLIAEYEQQALAAMFLIITSHRGSYLYGASSGEHRNLMATYALQWEAIRISKELGCTDYDMFGVAPRPDSSHPMYGLYKFKTGFGGELFHRLGCWDYPLDEDKYTSYKFSELRSQGFHLN
jgi:lipid II:glycine glycyltransferase (peptidoglycan interpeptide bridge formation enzyme)